LGRWTWRLWWRWSCDTRNVGYAFGDLCVLCESLAVGGELIAVAKSQAVAKGVECDWGQSGDAVGG
jgi:hypothetical protein